MIHVLAIITTQPGQRDAVLEKFEANVPNVLAEAGCIAYEATVDVSPGPASQTPLGRDTFCVVEKWESMEALQAHFKAPHMTAYGNSTRDLVVSRVIHILTPA